MSLTLDEIRVVETLVLKKGYIKTRGQGSRGWFDPKGDIYIEGQNHPNPLMSVSAKMIRTLYEYSLLTQRLVDDGYVGREHYYTIWEVYMPRLSKFECFNELSIQYAVGAV